MEVHDKFYTIGLKRIYEFLNDITKGICKQTGQRQAFITLIIRDIDNQEGNIDIIGNMPNEMVEAILEEALNTIKGESNGNPSSENNRNKF